MMIMVNRKRRQLEFGKLKINSLSNKKLMCWFFFFENREYNQKSLLLSSQKLAFHQLYFFQFPSFSRISTTRFLLFLVSAYHKLCFSVVLVSVPYPSCGVFTTVCSLSTNNLTLFSSKFFTTKLF